MRSASGERVSGWATGGASFAATMMILVGFFQIFNGVGAIANDDWYVVGKHSTFNLDVTAWGWLHLIPAR